MAQLGKPEIRAMVRAKLGILPPLVRAMQEELVNAMLMEASGSAQTLLLYKAKVPELSLVSLANAAFRSGKRVVMPRVEGSELTIHLVRGWHDLQPGAFGIAEPRGDCPFVEPEEIEFAAVPGVAWTVAGDRLGHGGGFYDKLLPNLMCPRVGVAFDCQIVAAVPMEPHDVAVDDVCFAGKLTT
jgi:5-formyltetrahydrofolate cyclo-ligase